MSKQIVYVITTHTDSPVILGVAKGEESVLLILREYELENQFDRTRDYDAMAEYMLKQGPLCGELYFAFIDKSETPDYQRKAVKVTPMLVR